jgi:prepilin-type N-terminal cleavage/methylation domain-containing protein
MMLGRTGRLVADERDARQTAPCFAARMVLEQTAGRLAKRRVQTEEGDDAGFTLVELVVVLVIWAC